MSYFFKNRISGTLLHASQSTSVVLYFWSNFIFPYFTTFFLYSLFYMSFFCLYVCLCFCLLGDFYISDTFFLFLLWKDLDTFQDPFWRLSLFFFIKSGWRIYRYFYIWIFRYFLCYKTVSGFVLLLSIYYVACITRKIENHLKIIQKSLENYLILLQK